MTFPFGHIHTWETVGTNWHPAALGHTPEDTEELRYGVTFVMLRCTACGLVNQERIIGHFKSNGIEETTN